MGNKTYDVICIGQTVQDIIITEVPENALSGDCDTVLAKDLVLTSGGDAVNEASMLAKLGNRAALLTRLDNRSVGDMVYNDLKENGVDTSLILRADDCRTFSTVIVVKPDGSHSFLRGPGRNCALTLPEIDLALLGQTRMVTAASLFGLSGLDRNGIDVIFREAQKAGAITVADMNFDEEGLGPDAVAGVYPYTDYLMPSLDEAVYVTGKKDPDAIADFFLEAGVGHVILKLGGEGSFFKDKKERFFTDPHKVTPLDTTGCGDNYVAAFFHFLLKGKSHRECAQFASAAGALNSLGIGAHHHIKNEQQVLEFMETAQQVKLNRE